MLLLLCMLVIAVFHLDEHFFASKRCAHRPKALCGPCLNGKWMLTDPDGGSALLDRWRRLPGRTVLFEPITEPFEIVLNILVKRS